MGLFTDIFWAIFSNPACWRRVRLTSEISDLATQSHSAEAEGQRSSSYDQCIDNDNRQIWIFHRTMVQDLFLKPLKVKWWSRPWIVRNLRSPLWNRVFKILSLSFVHSFKHLLIMQRKSAAYWATLLIKGKVSQIYKWYLLNLHCGVCWSV